MRLLPTSPRYQGRLQPDPIAAASEAWLLIQREYEHSVLYPAAKAALSREVAFRVAAEGKGVNVLRESAFPILKERKRPKWVAAASLAAVRQLLFVD
jgi:hypothetical protein